MNANASGQGGNVAFVTIRWSIISAEGESAAADRRLLWSRCLVCITLQCVRQAASYITPFAARLRFRIYYV